MKNSNNTQEIKKMLDLKNLITRGPSASAPKILLLGVEGVGKSTAGSQCDSPVFLCSESGLVGSQFEGVAHFTPKTYKDALDFVDAIADQNHEYKTLVIDTADWMEPLVNAAVIARAGKADIRSIEDFGFGKGYELAVDEWRQMTARLDRVAAKGVMVLVLAHTMIKPFNNPTGENYDRYEPKLAKKSAGLMKEWADCVLFAEFETFVSSGAKGMKAKGAGGTIRVVHTERTAAWDAKNRYNLPATMPFDFPAIIAAIKDDKDSVKRMEEEIRTLAHKLPDDKKAATLKWLESKHVPNALSAFLNKIRALTAEDDTNETTTTTTK